MDDRCRHFLEETALEIRKDVVRMISLARSEQSALALSLVDVLVYLYWKVLRTFPTDPGNPLRDRFVLSDGLGGPALYVVLAAKGFFSRDELWSFSRLGAVLQGMPFPGRTPGVDAPGGPPGQGLGIALGMVMALGKRRCDGAFSASGMSGEETASYVPAVFCCMNLEELREGCVWDAARVAARDDALGGLRVVVNCPGWNGKTEPCRDEEMERLASRFRDLGWKAAVGDGHDFASVEEGFAALSTPERKDGTAVSSVRGASCGVPGVLFLRTRYGKGVSAEENRDVASEGRPVFSRPRLDSALRELERRGGGSGTTPQEESASEDASFRTDVFHSSGKEEFL
jgi:transketolase